MSRPALRNAPPEDESLRVMPASLRDLTRRQYEAVGMNPANASVMADFLVASDLRGIYSHGTHQSERYLGLLKEGQLNPNPEPVVEHELPAAVIVDGDGGLGYFAAKLAMERAIAKAKELGVGAGICRNHHHFGAAGHYTRMAVAADCLGFATSSHVRELGAGQHIYAAGGISPMSFAAPAGEEPPLVVDMGTSIRSPKADDFEELFRRIPAAFFKTLGLGAICNAFGGILAGIWALDASGETAWPAVNQGAFLLAVDIGAFKPLNEFKAELDDYIARVAAMDPFPGYARATLPGAREEERTHRWRETGIPVDRDHVRSIQRACALVGIESPFAADA